MIEFTLLNKQALLVYIDSSAFYDSDVLPISYHRALSQSKNPSVQENDTLLILATVNQKIVGYLGILPDEIYDDSGVSIHCGWMSCLWVSPEHRGKKIAQNLIKLCFESWKGRILLTEFTAEAGSLYEKMNIFDSFHSLHGMRWYIKSNLAQILSNKKPIFKKLSPVLKSLDMINNLVLTGFDLFSRSDKLTYTMEKVEALDDDISNLVLTCSTKSTFRRDKEALQWICDNPWILVSPYKDEMALKYHFSSTEPNFEHNAYKITNSTGKMCAFIMVTNRNGHLRMPYCYHEDGLEAIKNVLKTLICQWKIHTCTIYNAELIAFLSETRFTRSLRKRLVRNYLISKQLNGALKNEIVKVQDGDGDCAFT